MSLAQSLRRATAVSLRELRSIMRDRLFFSLAFLVPMFFMLIFNYGLNMDVRKQPLALLDRDDTPLSREFAARFVQSDYFTLRSRLTSLDKTPILFAHNAIRAVLVIPHGFQKRLQQGGQAQVQAIVDGSLPSRAQTAKGYMEGISQAFAADLAKNWLLQQGISSTRARDILRPLAPEVRYLYNRAADSNQALAPRLLMLIMIICPPLLTALGIVREKESGSIANYRSSQAGRGEYLAGKLAPYVLISLCNCLLLWLLAVTVFQAPFRGNALFFAVACGVYAACTTGIGLTVSVLVKTQVAGTLVAFVVTTLPSVLYSGIFIPISALGPEARLVAHALPAMYFTKIVSGSFLKGLGWLGLWQELAALASYSLLLFGVGYALFGKRPKS